MKKMMILAATATLAFAAQGRAADTTATTSSSMPPTATNGAAPSTTTSNTMAGVHLTDEQIAGIMKQANDAEIDAAKIARSRATDSQVKDFAKHMIDEHTKNNKMAKSVEKRSNISATSSDNSKTMERDKKAKGSELKDAQTANFDRTYIDQQVTMHSQLLKDLDATYIPQTQNAEMKAFLEQTRMHVQKHLTMAQQIQAKLEGSGQAAGTVQQ